MASQTAPAAEVMTEDATAARAAAAITGAIVEGAADLADANMRGETPGESRDAAVGPVEGEASDVTVEGVATDVTDQVASTPAQDGEPSGEAPSNETAETPEEPAEPSPVQAVAPAARAVSNRAVASASHQPESSATGAAMASSNRPDITRRRSAEAQGAAQAGDAETGEVNRQTFRQQLREAIDNAMPPPRNEDEAERLMNEGGEDAAREIQGSLGGHTADATGGLPAAVDDVNQPDPSAQDGGEEVPLEHEALGEAPAAVSAGPVVAPASAPQAVDMTPNREDADALAAENNITDSMLAKGNDPQFTATLGAKDEAERHNEEGPAQLREAEAVDRAGTRERAVGVIGAGLSDFHGTRATRLNEVAGQQSTTSGLTERRKAEITETIEGIGQRTREAVTQILDNMTEEVGTRFQTA
ncbi:conserved hypothetical protein, partial [Rhodobacteraceae bacterium KLH11]